MTHVSLFSGVGGIDLAAEWAGFETVLQVEIDPYCKRVLEKHWPDVKRIEDIRDVKADSVNEPITLVSGGFPCQPFSVAGKRRGTKDDRWFWPEMRRVIQEIAPAWVLAENVPGILSLQSGFLFNAMLIDLEAAGYETWTGLIPAAGVGAPHLRYRVFIVAHSEQFRRGGRNYGDEERHNGEIQTARSGAGEKQGILAHANGRGLSESRVCQKQPQRTKTLSAGEDVAYTGSNRGRIQQISGREREDKTGASDDGPKKSLVDSNEQHGNGNGFPAGTISQLEAASLSKEYWLSEPDVGRVASRVPNRVDRLRCLGNAVVPAQVLPILRAIARVEMEEI